MNSSYIYVYVVAFGVENWILAENYVVVIKRLAWYRMNSYELVANLKQFNEKLWYFELRGVICRLMPREVNKCFN